MLHASVSIFCSKINGNSKMLHSHIFLMWLLNTMATRASERNLHFFPPWIYLKKTSKIRNEPPNKIFAGSFASHTHSASLYIIIGVIVWKRRILTHFCLLWRLSFEMEDYYREGGVTRSCVQKDVLKKKKKSLGWHFRKSKIFDELLL